MWSGGTGTAAELQHMDQGGQTRGNENKAEPRSTEGGGGEFTLKSKTSVAIVETNENRRKESTSNYVPCIPGKHLAEAAEAHAALIIVLFSGFDVQFSH